MSDKTDKPGDAGAWVPSAEQPVPPTTEFQAISPDEPSPIGGAVEPDETPAAPGPDAEPAASEPAGDLSPGSASAASTTPTPAADDDATLPPETPATPEAAASALGTEPPSTDPPAWKTPAASGLPPQWGDPDVDAGRTGPQPSNDISNLWGLAPEDRPEVLLGAALAGGVLAAIVVRSLARR